MINQYTAISVLCKTCKSHLTSRGCQTQGRESELAPKQDHTPPSYRRAHTHHIRHSKTQVRQKHKMRTASLLQQWHGLKIDTISTPFIPSTLNFQVFQLWQCLPHNIHWLPNAFETKKNETLLDIFRVLVCVVLVFFKISFMTTHQTQT